MTDSQIQPTSNPGIEHRYSVPNDRSTWLALFMSIAIRMVQINTADVAEALGALFGASIFFTAIGLLSSQIAFHLIRKSHKSARIGFVVGALSVAVLIALGQYCVDHARAGMSAQNQVNTKNE